MAHEVTTDNAALIYSIRDAVNRAERILEEHSVSEEAVDANEQLEALDSLAWDVRDALAALYGEEA